jgi:hypothetical protein
MKNYLLSFGLLLALAPGASYAQAGSHEISASYGIVSGTQVLRRVSQSETPSTIYPYYNVQTANSGNIFLTYRYALIKEFEIGFTAGFQSYSYDRYNSNMYYYSGGGTFDAKVDATVMTYAVEFKPVYYTGKYFQLYGFLGTGVRFYHETFTPSAYAYYTSYNDFAPSVFINTQWTPIGMRFGNILTGFAEFGFGYKGVANCGLSYRFNAHHPDAHHAHAHEAHEHEMQDSKE